jgi:uncharacterized protein with HEPN domain
MGCMFDINTQKDLISTLENILLSIQLIQDRFSSIESSDDFFDTKVGLEHLDSISMRLIAIGEGFKNIDKLTSNQLLQQYNEVDWKGIKGIRDKLSHHYFDIDSEIIFDICDTNIEELLEITTKMLNDIK